MSEENLKFRKKACDTFAAFLSGRDESDSNAHVYGKFGFYSLYSSHSNI